VERTFSVEETNELLPQLVALVTRLKSAYGEFHVAAQAVRRRAASNGSPAGSSAEQAGEYTQLLSDINELGVIVRDPESGLCDFPALRNDEPIYLCWRLGEERVAFWHPVDTGVAGREPL
jgi:hypothetical protein